MHSRTGFLLALAGLLNIVAGQLEVAPQSTTVILSESLALYCRGQQSQGDAYATDWQYNAMDHMPRRIVHNCQVTPGFSSDYQVEVTPEGNCNLLAATPRLSYAGTYTCQHTLDQASADVVVLNSNSTCSYNPQDDFIPGDKLDLFCFINYNGTKSPQMTWKADDGSQMNNDTTNTFPEQVNSRLIVPVYAPKTRAFTCTTYSTTREIVWVSPILDVQYPPNMISIIASDRICNRYYAGYSSLTCSADGYPVPSYEWTLVATNETFSGAHLALTEVGVNTYVCRAWNVIRGNASQPLEASRSIAVFAGPPPPECPIETTAVEEFVTTSGWTTAVPVLTTEPPITIDGCGSILAEVPSDTYIPDGWEIGCYVVRQTQYLDTPCRELIQDLPPDIGDADALLAMGGNFGCTAQISTDFSNVFMACYDNYQQTLKFNECPQCQHMITCIRKPAPLMKRHRRHRRRHH